ncbi:hypothetical protein CL619_04575 [archaeon]|nr:hypothetical protein [archaeon]|tara:strand:+ start:1837 stop:2430 length:594 start_codon:yes stop_codon:yes gene_type:complete
MDGKNTAIISIDMQNDYCDPNGRIAEFGMGVEQLQKVAIKAKEFVEKVRRTDMSLIHIQMTEDPEFLNEELVKQRIKEFGEPENWALAEPGTFGYELVLDVKDNEKIFAKNHYSAFSNYSFTKHLKDNVVKRIIVMGGFTHACVRATVFDALERGFEVTVVKDLVASPDVLETKHRWALEEMENKGAKISLSESVVL